jgi:gas vesicle protein GvpL/GvpF
VSDSVLWVYGVVAQGLEAPPAGVDGHPVRIHPHAEVSALVSDVPADRFSVEALKTRLEDLDSLEALARSHEAVLDAALTRGAVVPFRLCTIYSSPALLDETLDREQAALAATLERLAGAQEWGVKAFRRARAAVAAGDAPASGAEYLARKRADRDAAESGRDAADEVVAAIHARLGERAADAALGRPQDRRLSGRDAEMVLNAAYLVRSGEVSAFRELVERLDRDHEDVELELTGPWPPYHFVETPEP